MSESTLARPLATDDALVLPGLLRATWLVARKDLAIEFRTRTAFFSALVFALLGLTIFYFAWDPTAVAAIDLAIYLGAGILGVAGHLTLTSA